MIDPTILRAKIADIRSRLNKIDASDPVAEIGSRLDEIDGILDNHELEINQEKRFNHRLPHFAKATGEDFFASMEVISNARNALILQFLTEHGSQKHYYYPDLAKGTLRSFTAYRVFRWLTEKDKREIERFRNIGKKGTEQILEFLSGIEDALSS
ncbi:MAG TPA: hypothetical protein VGE26_08350 [Sphingobacteriaceae bacterium]